jgi:iron(III) transport system ATP-binding protein/putative spermidine/putrescine transport system ATP-binding protein
VRGRIAERAYLGETWDYLVALECGQRLRVAALPAQVFEADEDVWLEFDPSQMVAVS